MYPGTWASSPSASITVTVSRAYSPLFWTERTSRRAASMSATSPDSMARMRSWAAPAAVRARKRPAWYRERKAKIMAL